MDAYLFRYRNRDTIHCNYTDWNRHDNVEYKEREKEAEKAEPQQESASRDKQRERDRATAAIFFYPFLDHVTKNQFNRTD